MIASLLKSRELRLHLPVLGLGLLLLLATFPEPSGGLKCYSCNDDPADPKNPGNPPNCTASRVAPRKETCESGALYCRYWDWDAGNGKKVARGCVSNKEAECVMKAFDSNCGKSKGATDLYNKLESCKDAAPATRAGGTDREQEDSRYTRQCFCEKDVCNRDPCMCGGSREGGHLTFVIIFAILTFTYYNHI